MSTSTPTPNPPLSTLPPTSSPSALSKFDTYPWHHDRPFLAGLVAMLGPLSNTFERQKALSVTLQARIWWYQSRHSILIDRSVYETYTASHPSGVDAALLERVEEIRGKMQGKGQGGDSQKGAEVPEWMLGGRKVDLGVKADDAEDYQGVKEGGEVPPYPKRFEAIVEAVTKGGAVEGVREIPNTVVRQAGITPVGKMQAPRKPWERQQQGGEGMASSGLGRVVDETFPVLDESPSVGAEPSHQ